MTQTRTNDKLTPKNVTENFFDCFYKEEELEENKIPEDCVMVEGIRGKCGFNPERLEKNKRNIQEMIDELPDEFKEGWTFLNLCKDKKGNLWTGDHEIMEQLVILGIAIGKMEFTMPREMWFTLPGSMPYVTVL